MANWWGSIREKVTLIKGPQPAYMHDVGIAVMIILLGVSAFGLGRLSLLEESRPAIAVYEREVASAPSYVVGGKYVASVRGSKYHFPWCPGARAMNETNKRWFDSVEDAVRAGYAPASNCKGLVPQEKTQ